MALDFSTAFDRSSKPCIQEILDISNFGTHFQSLVLAVLNGAKRCVQNGDWLSKWFPAERGERQGCPLSLLLFIMAVGTLTIKMRSNQK